jgi:acetolactate synthase-1/2/3 large subunit
MEEGDIPQIGVDIYTPDFIGLGKAFGCHAVVADDLDQLKQALVSAADRQLPTVIEVKQHNFIEG